MRLRKDSAEHDRSPRRRHGLPCRCRGRPVRPRSRPGATPTSRSPASCAPKGSVASRTTCSSTPAARGLDFRNDTEVHVLARGKREETGLEYGATIEFEADTNETVQHRRDLGLPARRLGRAAHGRRGRRRRQQHRRWPDDRGRHRRHRRLRCVIAGIAGMRVPDRDRRRHQDPLLHASFGGFSLGVSFTPTQQTVGSGSNNGTSCDKNGDLRDGGRERLRRRRGLCGDLGGVGLEASMVGLYGRLKNGAEPRRRLRRQVLV